MSLSPLMQQYWDIKKNYHDSLLLFQVGDFYELFYDDAKIAAGFLGITLTKRGISNHEPIPLCGVPVHTIDHYLLKLVRGGFRVALCNQLIAPTLGKVVDRGVTQVLTPGTLIDSKFLPEKSASYLAVVIPQKESYALVSVEVLTGQLFATVVEKAQEKLFEAELVRFSPAEIVIPASSETYEQHLKRMGFVTTKFAAIDACEYHFTNWFENLKSESKPFIEQTALLSALKLLHSYLFKNNEKALGTLQQISLYVPDDFMVQDAATQKNLELVINNFDHRSEHTLFSVLDHAVTSMGSRLIKKWLTRPSIQQTVIQDRLDAVASFLSSAALRESVEELLKAFGDLERVIGRIALEKAHIHDYQQLLRSSQTIPSLKTALGQLCLKSNLLARINDQLMPLHELVDFLTGSLNADFTKEWLIAPGFNAELDRLRLLVEQGAQAIYALELAQQARTGISSLKIRYHQSYGYGIEITKNHSDKIPADYIRLQTLVNRERFTCVALKDLEYDINRAHKDSATLEQELYQQVKNNVAQYLYHLRSNAQGVAECDALFGLAQAAYKQQWVRPEFNNEKNIVIHEGRHPVVTEHLQHNFIPNDTSLTESESLWIITGPNMGGKSTYLRQVAIICIMAQMGSFVPAKSASLPIIDRIFTRIGAADQVAHGKSTFLVEMEETALICNQATQNSLVILDEVGRGTSTYDGLAIAQAVVEYIYTTVKARCLFATHYHELTQLSIQYPGIAAYHAASSRQGDAILLLHKILPGIAEGSFGIEVAKTANLPQQIILRAEEIVKHLKY